MFYEYLHYKKNHSPFICSFSKSWSQLLTFCFKKSQNYTSFVVLLLIINYATLFYWAALILNLYTQFQYWKLVLIKIFFRLQALSIILVVPYHLFYVISCVAEVCLSCEGVEQYREKIEWNCYIFNFDRVTHKLTPQSTWLFYRKDLLFVEKTL